MTWRLLLHSVLLVSLAIPSAVSLQQKAKATITTFLSSHTSEKSRTMTESLTSTLSRSRDGEREGEVAPAICAESLAACSGTSTVEGNDCSFVPKNATGVRVGKCKSSSSGLFCGDDVPEESALVCKDHVVDDPCEVCGAPGTCQVLGGSTMYCRKLPPKCPKGTIDAGAFNDVPGCGLNCDDRFGVRDIEECMEECEDTVGCNSFSFAPEGADSSYPNETVCTLYSDLNATATWGYGQQFCIMKLECPNGTTQVGDLQSDIYGCGLESCGDRYGKTLEECREHCKDNNSCKSFSFAPVGGDEGYPDKTVCTIYDSDTANSQHGPQQILCQFDRAACPPGTEDVGEFNDVSGCGLTACDARTGNATVEECAEHCRATNSCNSFSFAPLGGDSGYPNDTVCTLYSETNATAVWGTQNFCTLLFACPNNTVQIGELNDDISGCGLEACDARFNKTTISACRDHCNATSSCVSFSFAPIGGDRGLPDVPVCTLYDKAVPDSTYGPKQLMCGMIASS
uniref:Apple domain-containing protein n=1 Tax=Chromera velia CCMP2878 TaxID=1169474 RepID=A0A0G4IBR5_9ALVE|mmetsp:Transcript_19874/g.39971  ORF Transcript_19874/g.39971 Transcript_19874/m.39971 type:complete len:513 (+) Transcript_19874:316-1854(+)|eukprot:Cvel_12900.t1-p1 / transcript=Cvel_12900.t1 / gene=Cvel_12900 / organism=Chromera_velia_CCMP2878 / gene_product=hypothetical protein / transcript_product=hypothetical protein / location=Cvel_scaffold862:3665-10786(+) / protein_length=512 / sequence_SO=supercontig / SO=protein_coding / is_pseudo=false